MITYRSSTTDICMAETPLFPICLYTEVPFHGFGLAALGKWKSRLSGEWVRAAVRAPSKRTNMPGKAVKERAQTMRGCSPVGTVQHKATGCRQPGRFANEDMRDTCFMHGIQEKPRI